MTCKDSKYCTCLYYSANAFARNMTKMAEEEFAITGLAPSYAFLLMTVNEVPGIQPKDISVQMQLTPSTVTRLIEKMEAKGYLERNSIGRATEVYPTKKSLALQITLKKAWNNLYRRYTNLLGEQEARELTTSLHEATIKLEE